MLKRGLLLLAAAFVAAVGCGVPHDRPTKVHVSSVDDPRQCTEYGFAKTTAWTDFSTDCGDPKSNLRNADGVPTGPILQMTLWFNCGLPAGETWYQRYDWFQCLNDVSHPSGGQPQVTWSPGCILVDNICTATQQLPDDVMFVDASTPEGLLLRALVDKIEKARVALKAQGGSDLNDRLKVIDAAALFGDLADAAFVKRQRMLAMQSVSTAMRLVDAAVNFVPGAAMVRDAIIVVTGTNVITGETLDDTERAMVAGTLLVPAFLEGGARGLVDLGEALSDVAKSGKAEAAVAEDLLGAIGRSDDSVADLVNLLPCTFSRAPVGGHAPLPEAKKCTGGAGEATAEMAKEGERVLDWLKGENVGLGEASSTDYRNTYKKAYAYIADELGDVHHAVPQDVLNKFSGLFTPEEIHSLENLRGMPFGPDGNALHRGEITSLWNDYLKGFYDSGTVPTREQLLSYALEIDNMYGNQFLPPIR